MPILRLQAPHLDADDIEAGKSSLSSSHTDVLSTLSVVLSADTLLCVVATVADMVAMAAMAATVVATVVDMAAMVAMVAMVATEATVMDMAAMAAMEAMAAMAAMVATEAMAAMVTAGEHRSISLNFFCDKENFSICLLRKETS